MPTVSSDGCLYAEEIIRLISDVNAERKKAFTFTASLNKHFVHLDIAADTA